MIPNEVLTVQEVADYLRVSRTTVWRWCHEGRLPAFKVGRGWRIHRGDVEKVVRHINTEIEYHNVNVELQNTN